MKIDMDKYYTSKLTAQYCIDVFNSMVTGITEWIEPAAGDGSFSLLLPLCIPYDIEPEHPSIIRQDFLKLELPYKPGRAFIGNPPFGNRTNLATQFFKHAVKMGDSIGFILPSGQYNNPNRLYEFDLIHSEMLPLMEYSGRKLLCCFNIYKRPADGLLKKKPKRDSLEDVDILNKTTKSFVPLEHYDYGIMGWGGPPYGFEIAYQGQYENEFYFIIHNEELKEKIIQALKDVDWSKRHPKISTPALTKWQIYKYLREVIPGIK